MKQKGEGGYFYFSSQDISYPKEKEKLLLSFIFQLIQPNDACASPKTTSRIWKKETSQCFLFFCLFRKSIREIRSCIFPVHCLSLIFWEEKWHSSSKVSWCRLKNLTLHISIRYPPKVIASSSSWKWFTFSFVVDRSSWSSLKPSSPSKDSSMRRLSRRLTTKNIDKK